MHEACFDLVRRNSRVDYRTARLALAIISGGGKSEADYGFVGLLRLIEVPCEPSALADHDGQNARCHRVERSEVADASRTCDAAHFRHDVVRSPSAWFVHDDNA